MTIKSAIIIQCSNAFTVCSAIAPPLPVNVSATVYPVKDLLIINASWARESNDTIEYYKVQIDAQSPHYVSAKDTTVLLKLQSSDLNSSRDNIVLSVTAVDACGLSGKATLLLQNITHIPGMI